MSLFSPCFVFSCCRNYLWTSEEFVPPVRQSGPYLIRITYDDDAARRKAKKAARIAAAAAEAAANEAAAAAAEAAKADHNLEEAMQKRQQRHEKMEEQLDIVTKEGQKQVEVSLGAATAPPCLERTHGCASADMFFAVLQATQQRGAQELASALSALVSKIDQELQVIEGKIGDNMCVAECNLATAYVLHERSACSACRG